MFIEFYEHELPEKGDEKPDFDFCHMTVLHSDFAEGRPVFQAKLRSKECLNLDIEWTVDYFSQVRKAFETSAF